jgi:hypothetical protein
MTGRGSSVDDWEGIFRSVVLSKDVLMLLTFLQIPFCNQEMVLETNYCQRFGYCSKHLKAEQVILSGVPSR